MIYSREALHGGLDDPAERGRRLFDLRRPRPALTHPRAGP